MDQILRIIVLIFLRIKLAFQRRVKLGFSMIELSISLMIISILIGFSIKGGALISYGKTLAARSSSANSPFISDKDLTLWLNSVSESAFSEPSSTQNVASMTNLARIDRWSDSKPSLDAKLNLDQSTSASMPAYRDSAINTLPGVFFDGGDSLQASSISPIQLFSDSRATIFIVLRYFSGNSNIFSWSSGNNAVLLSGLSATNVLSFRFGGTNAAQSQTSFAFSSSADFSSSPKILTLVKNKNSMSMRMNGAAIGSGNSSATSFIDSSAAGNLLIGSSLSGLIGEVIVFKTALDADYISKIEDYLSKKWSISTSVTVDSSQCFCSGSYIQNNSTCVLYDCPPGQAGARTMTCQNGILTQTSSTCGQASCSLGGGTGYSSKVNLSVGNNNSFSCDAGYTGTIFYYCPSNGGRASFSSGSCTVNTCSLAAGNGYNARSGLATGIGSFTCNSGFTGTINYNCPLAGGAASVTTGSCVANTCTLALGIGYSAKSGLATGIGSFACDSGYTGTINFNCPLAGGSASVTSGLCTVNTCSLALGTGYSAKSGLATGNGSFACDVSGYNGTINYNCPLAGGSAYVTSGSCAVNTCSLAAGTGYSAKSGLATGAGSFSCNSGYTGTITYNCPITGGSITGSGTCTAVVTCTCSHNIYCPSMSCTASSGTCCNNYCGGYTDCFMCNANGTCTYKNYFSGYGTCSGFNGCP